MTHRFAILVVALVLAGRAQAQDAGAGMPSTPAVATVDASAPDSTAAAPAPLSPLQAAAPPVATGMPLGSHFNAGFGNEVFYLRSDDDNFILIHAGRFQMDGYGYQGAGHDKVPFDTFTAKRARIELFGTFMKHFDFQLGSELTNATTPVATDVYINAFYTSYANLQVGQFDVPFTMENRTSDKYTDMQERSRVVAAFAYPENKNLGAMYWGMPQGKWAYWSAGVFNGEGLDNFKHQSNHFDAAGRAWIAPLALAGNELLKNVWVGASYLNGFRNESPGNPYYDNTANFAATFANQLDRAAMKDTAGLTFFNPVSGNVHAGDYGQRTGYGAELNAPIGPVVLKGEVIHSDEGLRELDLTNASKPVYVRASRIRGTGFYARASYFVWGDPLINGLAGQQLPPRLFGELKPGKTDTALQLVANWDHLGFDYEATNDPGGKDPFAGHYGVNIYGIGVNWWCTKHVRVTGDWLFDDFAGSGYVKPDGTFKNAPLAPASNKAYEGTLRFALAI